MNYKIAGDAILRVQKGEGWILSNPRARRHLELDRLAMAAIADSAEAKSAEEWEIALGDGMGWDRSAFSNADGLMVDPTGFGPRKGEALRGRELFEAMKRARLVETEGRDDYLSFLAPQTSLLDQGHLGTFHQAVGRFQLRDLRRKDSWRWWHDQKFSPDGLELKPGLYRWVQGHFFDRFFSTVSLDGTRLLDFGCGNGFYSRRFAELGAEVIGLDTSPELLDIARRNHPGIEFVLTTQDDAGHGLDAIPSASYDVVYMSDVLLFFFHDLKTHQRDHAALEALLSSFRRILKPSGTLYFMEPNATFWLAPWYGEPPVPYTVVTEYRNHIYSVAPTPEDVITALAESGFAVTTFRHPEVQDFDDSMDEMAYAFARNFPLWDFYGCRPFTG